MIYNGIAADGDIFPNGYTNLYFAYESDYKHGSRKNLRDAYRAAIARYGFNTLVIQTEADNIWRGVMSERRWDMQYGTVPAEPVNDETRLACARYNRDWCRGKEVF